MFRSLYEQYGEAYLSSQPQQPQVPSSKPAVFPWPASFQNLDLSFQKEFYELVLTSRNQTNRIITGPELMALPKVIQNRRIISPQGWTYRADWGGTLLKSILPPDIPSQAEMILLVQTNLAGETFTYPLADLLNQNALLCYEVNGHPLPHLYGGPLWLMVFDRFHYVGLAQLHRLALIPRTEDMEWQIENEQSNYFWMKRHYSSLGAVQPSDYYAFDLKTSKPIGGNGEITEY